MVALYTGAWIETLVICYGVTISRRCKMWKRINEFIWNFFVMPFLLLIAICIEYWPLILVLSALGVMGWVFYKANLEERY